MSITRYPGGHLGLPEKLVKPAFINNQQKTLDTPLADGDKINLFPPVVGG